MKKLYWQIDSNADLSCVCSTAEECLALMISDFESLDPYEQAETEYTITPVALTDEEYHNMDEAY